MMRVCTKLQVLRGATFAIAAMLLSNCVSYEPRVLVPALTLTAEDITLSTTSAADGVVDFGLDVTTNESDSLVNIEILPGVRVRSVSPGGAAEAGGIRPGDVILSVNDIETNQPDALLAIGQQAGNNPFQFTIRRNTLVFETEVEARAQSSTLGPRELYRVDPLATRAGYRTELVGIRNQPAVPAAKVVELFADSPLPAAGIAIDDIVLAIDGEPLNSAQDLITRLNQQYEFGSTVAFTVFNGNDLDTKSVTLWDPGRRISRVSLGPLFKYESSLNPSTDSLTVLDLWLFAVYRYNRVDGEKSHSVFGLLNYSSNYGELIEESN